MKIPFTSRLKLLASKNPRKNKPSPGRKVGSVIICSIRASDGKLSSARASKELTYPCVNRLEIIITSPVTMIIAPGNGLSSQTQDLPESLSRLTETASEGRRVAKEKMLAKAPTPESMSKAVKTRPAKTVKRIQYQYSALLATPPKVT